jgi:hypothetical protein
MKRIMKRYFYSLGLMCMTIILITNITAFAEDVPLIQELPDEKASINNGADSDAIEVKGGGTTGIGFGVGFNYIVNFDSRFSGFGNQFLFQFPLDKTIALVIFYESDKIVGSDSTGTTTTWNLEASMQTLRINKALGKFVAVFLGVGTATISGNFSYSTMLTDFGVKVTPLSAQAPGKLLSSTIGVDLTYRYLGVSTTSKFTPTSTAVTSLSGFGVGLNFTLLF